jgi:hypothetical protein
MWSRRLSSADHAAPLEHGPKFPLGACIGGIHQMPLPSPAEEYPRAFNKGDSFLESRPSVGSMQNGDVLAPPDQDIDSGLRAVDLSHLPWGRNDWRIRPARQTA